MVRRAARPTTGAKYGLRDWLAQRVTAVIMAIFILCLVGVLLISPPQGYAEWKGIFSNQWMRIASFLFLVSLFWHAWIGVRNILMDYVHPTGVRLTLQILVILSLLFYTVWSAEILWSM
jgi:succinate dehydrogenase / fumarate reductase membrane anchor subunit